MREFYCTVDGTLVNLIVRETSLPIAARLNRSGYGRKIPTAWLVQIPKDPRWRRIYATCFSNSSSAWITVKGARIHVS